VGAVVCCCFGVGRNSICAVIREFRLTSPQQIGQRLRAGTTCRSCVSELKALVNEERAAANLVSVPGVPGSLMRIGAAHDLAASGIDLTSIMHSGG